jgi:hypothetical protein
MQTITIELADNGVIKYVLEDNANAAGESYSSVIVYDFESENSSENKIKFLLEVSEDCGLEFGSTKDPDQIKITADWGDHYQPTKAEIEDRISSFKKRITMLESLLNKS